MILGALEDKLMEPEHVAEFVREFHAEVNRLRHQAELSLVQKRRDHDAVARKLAGVIEAIADGLRAPACSRGSMNSSSAKRRSRPSLVPHRRRGRGCTRTWPRCIGRRSPTFRRRAPIA
jgi:hypothetical protein